VRKLCMAVLLLIAGFALAQSTDSPTPSNTADQTQSTVSNTADQTKNTASDVADSAQSTARDAAGAVEKGAKNGYEGTKKGVKKGVGAVEHAVTPSSSDQGTDQSSSATGQEQSTENGSTRGRQGGSELPQTATPLPLLGLLGIGSFGVGIWRLRSSCR
jgi:hypothetical protein